MNWFVKTVSQRELDAELVCTIQPVERDYANLDDLEDVHRRTRKVYIMAGVTLALVIISVIAATTVAILADFRNSPVAPAPLPAPARTPGFSDITAYLPQQWASALQNGLIGADAKDLVEFYGREYYICAIDVYADSYSPVGEYAELVLNKQTVYITNYKRFRIVIDRVYDGEAMLELGEPMSDNEIIEIWNMALNGQWPFWSAGISLMGGTFVSGIYEKGWINPAIRRPSGRYGPSYEKIRNFVQGI